MAAILAGMFIFLGQAGEIAFGTPSDAVGGVYVTLSAIGFAALVVAIWRFGRLVRTRVGRIGWRVAVAGVVLLALFVVQVAITAALTGDIPDNFVLFGLGFRLLFIGQLLFAPSLRARLGRAWVLPLVAAAGLIVAISLDVHAIHDIGLFVFEGAWVALGVALLRAERHERRAERRRWPRVGSLQHLPADRRRAWPRRPLHPLRECDRRHARGPRPGAPAGRPACRESSQGGADWGGAAPTILPPWSARFRLEPSLEPLPRTSSSWGRSGSAGSRRTSWSSSAGTSGPVAWLWVPRVGSRSSNFIVFGVLLIAFALAVAAVPPRNRWVKLAPVVLALAGVAAAMLAFKTDPPGDETWHGFVHLAAYLIWLPSIVISYPLTWWRLQSHAVWAKAPGWPSLLVLLLFPPVFLLPDSESAGNYVFFAVVMTPLAAIAIRMAVGAATRSS